MRPWRRSEIAYPGQSKDLLHRVIQIHSSENASVFLAAFVTSLHTKCNACRLRHGRVSRRQPPQWRFVTLVASFPNVALHTTGKSCLRDPLFRATKSGGRPAHFHESNSRGSRVF